jgi:hypothetical protein
MTKETNPMLELSVALAVMFVQAAAKFGIVYLAARLAIRHART